MTLYPGDIILSGAADVAPVAPGDKMVLEIVGIGRLAVEVDDAIAISEGVNLSATSSDQFKSGRPFLLPAVTGSRPAERRPGDRARTTAAAII